MPPLSANARLLAIFSICYTATLGAQRPTRPSVRHVRLTVPADDSSWSTSGLILDEGDVIDVRAAGTISVSRFWPRVEANGARPGSGSERGSAYLEYRIGHALPQSAGKLAIAVADRAGLLQFRVHDERYDD